MAQLMRLSLLAAPRILIPYRRHQTLDKMRRIVSALVAFVRRTVTYLEGLCAQ